MKEHVHEWERGAHMAASFDMDGQTWACAICGLPRPKVAAVPSLRAIALELRERLVAVPYHRNPQIPAGEPFGYSLEGHREYSCPVCVTLSRAADALGEWPTDEGAKYREALPGSEPLPSKEPEK